MTLERIGTRLVLALSTITALMFTAPMQAQLPVLSGGTHVRLWLGPNQPKIEGTVFSQTADTVRVTSDGAVRVVPISMVAGVEVGGGRSHSAGALRGAKLGAIILGAAGLVIFPLSYDTYDGEKHSSDLIGLVGASAFAGAFYGAIIGGIAGAEGWTPVYPVRVALLVTRPNSRTTGVGLSFKF
jgi:hypothetical protein